ncbi:MAG TPA: hypothetical protein PKM36_04710 [Propionibacteriaceae bacterium]|nr:hypothetical protein [Propionibacteriaceae bacterium]HPZ49978.1 hypothetical protein [Propionibacteriaceae bacterium]HQE30800.1 hypothetical protein [Propionibacteriaceae bacterium]
MFPEQPGIRHLPVGTFEGGAPAIPRPNGFDAAGGVEAGVAAGAGDERGWLGVGLEPWPPTEAAATDDAPPGAGIPHTSQ